MPFLVAIFHGTFSMDTIERERETMNKREIKSETDKLVAEFLKSGGRITVCAPSTRRVKTFRR